MRYHPLILCLIAVSLGFATRRTDEKSSSAHGKQNIGTDIVHAVTVYEDQGGLIEDVKTCGHFLSSFTTLVAEPNNSTSLLNLVEACERVIVVVDKALEEIFQRHAGRLYSGRVLSQPHTQHDIEQVPLSLGGLYPGRIPALDTYQNEATISDLVKRRSKRKHRREEICEAKLCENENLEKTCNSKKIGPDEALICKMCYPVKDVNLINTHCQAKWKRERKAFYVVSFVLIGVTISSGLILYIRRRYLRAKSIQQGEFQDNNPVEDINPQGELYYYDGSRLDMMMPTGRDSPSVVNSSPDARQRDGSKRYNTSWDDYEGDMISTSAAQRRLKQLGLLSKTGRKKVHDLFDLEGLRSKYDATKSVQRQSNETDRIPVMPWAPNASVRMSDRESPRVRARTISKGSPAIELRDMSGTDAV